MAPRQARRTNCGLLEFGYQRPAARSSLLRQDELRLACLAFCSSDLAFALRFPSIKSVFPSVFEETATAVHEFAAAVC